MNPPVIATYKPRCLFFEALDMGQITYSPTFDKHDEIQWVAYKIGVSSIQYYLPEIPRHASFYQRFVLCDWQSSLSSSLVVVVAHLETAKLDRHYTLVTISRDTLALKVVIARIEPKNESFLWTRGKLCCTNILPKAGKNSTSMTIGEQSFVSIVPGIN